jgi:hypothetical protein
MKDAKAMGKCLTARFYSRLLSIRGKDIVMEIDESKFGKMKSHRDHRIYGARVLGMMERHITLVPVEDRKKETLVSLLECYIDSNSIIYSDFLKAILYYQKILLFVAL